ncbi:MAG: hypothetical protein ACN6P1_24775 [Pseudomonas sp.]
MQPSTAPSVRFLFRTLHPPRRFWPGLGGFYSGASQAARPRS